MAGTSQYFEPDPSVGSRQRVVQLTLPDLSLELVTDRGVFSATAIDPGTKLLLLESPHPRADGHLLDLGCGYGPIALTLARRAPDATVWATDVNRRALDLTRMNAEKHSVANVRVVAPEEVPADVQFAGIWSNPPIRIGKEPLHTLLRSWLARLEPDGHAWLVVQKHLGSDSLTRWLTDNGYPARRHCSRSGYRVLDVTQP